MIAASAIQRVVVYTHRQQGTFLDEEYVFHQVIAGTWEFRMAERCYRARPGDLILLPPYLLHTVVPEQETPLALNVCHFVLHQSVPELSQAPLVVSVPRSGRAEVARCFAILRREWLAQSPQRHLLLPALLFQILGLYLRHSHTEPAYEVMPKRWWESIQSAVAFLQKHQHESGLGIDAAANAAGLSRAHFSRQFKAQMGMSPYQYLCRYRMERAKELLMNRHLGCAEVATATGHRDVAAFSRAFRRLERMSPTQWLASTAFPGH